MIQDYIDFVSEAELRFGQQFRLQEVCIETVVR